MAWWLSWLERRPVTAEVVGSNPIRVVIVKLHINFTNGILAQLGEHLPYKQRVIGSSPTGPIDAGVAELADAQDLKSCCSDTVPVRFRSAAFIQCCISVEDDKYVCVAQLDRASGYGPEGRGFESYHVHDYPARDCRIFL